MTRKPDLKLAALAAFLGASAAAHAESGWSLLNMTPGVTQMSRKIYDLHMLIFWVCVVIGVVVFGVMIYSIAVGAKRKKCTSTAGRDSRSATAFISTFRAKFGLRVIWLSAVRAWTASPSANIKCVFRGRRLDDLIA